MMNGHTPENRERGERTDLNDMCATEAAVAASGERNRSESLESGSIRLGRPSIATRIDHTLLRADAIELDIVRICQEARRYRFASVCVNGRWIRLVSRLLDGSRIAVCSVVGFPLGASSTAIKAEEARLAVLDGASEIDMVISIGDAKSGDWAMVEADVAAVVAAAAPALVKAILETGLLSQEEIVLACRACLAAGVAFVKTSTGLISGGARVEDVRLMRQTVGNQAMVKASGGIRDLRTALQMVAAGADRLGCSAGVAIVEEEIAAGVAIVEEEIAAGVAIVEEEIAADVTIVEREIAADVAIVEGAVGIAIVEEEDATAGQAVTGKGERT